MLKKTTFTGYDTLLDTGKVLAIISEGTLADTIGEGTKAVIILDKLRFMQKAADKFAIKDLCQP